MVILAFDSTSEHGGVAVYRDRERLAVVASQGPANAYSVAVFHMVQEALESAKLQLSEIELFAVANGPGSFTGIRVGLAAAKGWAKAFARPVKGVSVLEAMVEEAGPKGEWAVPVLDARRGEFYLGLFWRPPGEASFQPHGEGLVLNPNELRAFLEELLSVELDRGPVTCVIREQDQSALSLQRSLPRSLRWASVSGTVLGAIARLALQAHKKGMPPSAAELDAYYIRRTDAELLLPRTREKTERGA